MNAAWNMDCMDAMKEFSDGFFDLAVVDPPYGINRFKHGETSRLRKYGSMKTVNDATPPQNTSKNFFASAKIR